MSDNATILFLVGLVVIYGGLFLLRHSPTAVGRAIRGSDRHAALDYTERCEREAAELLRRAQLAREGVPQWKW